MDARLFLDSCEAAGIRMSSDQVDQFREFEDSLYETNKVMNLTAVPREECWLRHFVDCLLMQDLIPRYARVLDIGTGPGFPAWPLACARPDLDVTAVDSSGKMIGFMQRNPLPNLTPILSRAENLQWRDEFDVVTGRAVAPLAIQLELSAAPAKVGGFVVPLRSGQDAAEIEAGSPADLGLRLSRMVRRILPTTQIERIFPIYEKYGRTPSRYPRSWAEIKRRPQRAAAKKSSANVPEPAAHPPTPKEE